MKQEPLGIARPGAVEGGEKCSEETDGNDKKKKKKKIKIIAMRCECT